MKDLNKNEELAVYFSYMLCTSPRSGSTLLCGLLNQSGVAGRPASYFRPESIPEYAKGWGVRLEENSWDKKYIKAVLKESANESRYGGLRIMWSNFPAFKTRLKELYPMVDNDRALLLDSLGVNKYVYLYRNNKLAQAVSLVIAKQTGLWHLNSDGSDREKDESKSQLKYSYDEISEELQMLKDEALGWEVWFQTNRIQPLMLEYEDLAANPKGALEEILTFIDVDRASVVDVGTKKMANALNKEWIDRYNNELMAVTNS
jgi:LPS sulfotransferase NodH